jgi:lactoylglutathione lyase/glyoxylase I family protein
LGFTEGLQFTRKGSDFGRYMQIADQTYLEMFEDPKRGPADNQGLAHFCLETDDMEALMAHLRAQGVTFTPKKLGIDFTWQIWLEDPDGNKFEVHQYSDKSMQRTGGVAEADW